MIKKNQTGKLIIFYLVQVLFVSNEIECPVYCKPETVYARHFLFNCGANILCRLYLQFHGNAKPAPLCRNRTGIQKQRMDDILFINGGCYPFSVYSFFFILWKRQSSGILYSSGQTSLSVEVFSPMAPLTFGHRALFKVLLMYDEKGKHCLDSYSWNQFSFACTLFYTAILR